MRKAFTLIELLIVMAVIAVLIGIAIPSFRGMQDEAKRAKAGGDLRVLKLALEAYQAKHDTYPTSLPSLEVEGTVVQKLPTDPFGTAYNFALCTGANPQYYAIWSVGANGTSNTTSISTAGVITDAAESDDIGTTNGTPSVNGTWR